MGNAVKQTLMVKFAIGLFENPLDDLSMATHLGSQDKMICRSVRLSDFCDKFIPEFQAMCRELNVMADREYGLYLVHIRRALTILEGLITRLIRKKEEAENLEIRWKGLLKWADNTAERFDLLKEQAKLDLPPPRPKPDFDIDFENLNRSLLLEYDMLMVTGLTAKMAFTKALVEIHYLYESEGMRIIGSKNREFEGKRIHTGQMYKSIFQVCDKEMVEHRNRESDRKNRIEQTRFRLDVRKLRQPGPVLMELQLQEDLTWIIPTTCRTPALQSSNVLCLDVRSHVHSTHLEEVALGNEFEKRIRREVRLANEIGVSFDDIGGLDTIKEALEESVIFPLRSGVVKPCNGVLLFGPPGTGKSMLVKALAKECRASLINISIATITSKWFGESEKIVQTLFNVAAEVSPTIILLDGVDNILGHQSGTGNEAMDTIKSEFIASWDRSLESSGSIVVVAATKEPFKLDKTVIRRFERRIMVSQPSLDSREKILRTLLAKETVDEMVDFMGLATLTEGFSGSHLKELCARVIHRALRKSMQESMQEERHVEKRQKVEKDQQGEKGVEACDANKEERINTPRPLKRQKVEKDQQGEKGVEACDANKEDRINTPRPLKMEDFKQARDEIGISIQAEGDVMALIRRWNELHGGECAGKENRLSYLL